ncbi:unnamed protein product, partial [Prorocentrum cordatum]
MGAVNGRLDSKIRNCFSTVAARGVDWIMATCLNADAEALGHDQMHAFQGSLLQPLCWTTTGSTRIDCSACSANLACRFQHLQADEIASLTPHLPAVLALFGQDFEVWLSGATLGRDQPRRRETSTW